MGNHDSYCDSTKFRADDPGHATGSILGALDPCCTHAAADRIAALALWRHLPPTQYR